MEGENGASRWHSMTNIEMANYAVHKWRMDFHTVQASLLHTAMSPAVLNKLACVCVWGGGMFEFTAFLLTARHITTYAKAG